MEEYTLLARCKRCGVVLAEQHKGTMFSNFVKAKIARENSDLSWHECPDHPAAYGVLEIIGFTFIPTRDIGIAKDESDVRDE